MPNSDQTLDKKIDWMGQYLRARRLRHLARLMLEDAQSRAADTSPVLRQTPRAPGPGNRVPKLAEALAQAEHQDRQAALTLRLARQQVCAAIDSLPQPQQRELLQRRYLLGQSLVDISRQMHLEYRWVRRLHRRAVEAAVQTGDAAA